MFSAKSKAFVSPYVLPLFEQRWGMFAPCPLVQGKVKMNIQYKNGETGWIHPAAEAVELHRLLHFTHHGELALLEANLVYWIDTDRIDFGLNYDEEFDNSIASIFMEQGHSYNLLKRYVYGVAMNLELTPISAEVKCEMENVKTKETGLIDFPKYKW